MEGDETCSVTKTGLIDIPLAAKAGLLHLKGLRPDLAWPPRRVSQVLNRTSGHALEILPFRAHGPFCALHTASASVIAITSFPPLTYYTPFRQVLGLEHRRDI